MPSDRSEVGEGQAGKRYCRNGSRGCEIVGRHDQCIYAPDSPSSSSPKPETCLRGSDGCEIKGRHDMCGTVQPKPEMLEKARALNLGCCDYLAMGDEDCPHVKAVALALEEAVRLERIAGSMFCAEALRASEASVESLTARYEEILGRQTAMDNALAAARTSVESLRKERDEARAERDRRPSWGRVTDMMEATRARTLVEVARSESDALKWSAAFAANHSCDEHCECAGIIAEDLRARAAIRAPRPSEPEWKPCQKCGASWNSCEHAPSSPTPPTSLDLRPTETRWLLRYEDPDRGSDLFAGAGAEKGARAAFENAKQAWTCALYMEVDSTGYVPTPPSEEPRQGTIAEVLERFKQASPETQRLAVDIMTRAGLIAVPSPEPTREEPR